MNWSDDTYRGDGPFSEPEVQNIRELISSRQVTNLITNHTYSNLVLRPPGVADFGFPLEEPLLQGARRLARRSQRLLEHPGLRALRHHRHHRGLVLLVHRRARVHVRDRRDRVPPAVRDGVEAEYLGPAPAGGRRQGRQPRGVLHDARGDRRRLAPLADRGHRAGRLDAPALEDVPDRDLAGVARRPRQLDRRPAPVHGHADVRAAAAGRRVRVAREPLDAAGRRRPPRPRRHRPAAGSDRAGEPARASLPRTPSTRPAGRSRRSRSRCRARPTASTTAG